MTKCHLIVSFLSLSFFKQSIWTCQVVRITRGALKNSKAWPHPKLLKLESLGAEPRHQFSQAPQVVSLCSQVESRCSGRIKTSSEVLDNRNINQQLMIKGQSILYLFSNMWCRTLYFQLKISVWKLLCIIMPPNVLCSWVRWESVTNTEWLSWYCI